MNSFRKECQSHTNREPNANAKRKTSKRSFVPKRTNEILSLKIRSIFSYKVHSMMILRAPMLREHRLVCQ